jgi:hypothetical protein
MKAYDAVEVEFHSFLTSALFGGEWLASHTGRYILSEPTEYDALWVLDSFWTFGEEKNSLPLSGI